MTRQELTRSANAQEKAEGRLIDALARLHQLKDQRLLPFGFFQPVDGADVGMVERGEHLGFTLEPGQSIWIVGERLRQDLQRHVAVELGVSGSIHLAL